MRLRIQMWDGDQEALYEQSADFEPSADNMNISVDGIPDGVTRIEFEVSNPVKASGLDWSNIWQSLHTLAGIKYFIVEDKDSINISGLSIRFSDNNNKFGESVKLEGSKFDTQEEAEAYIRRVNSHILRFIKVYSKHE